MPRRVVAVLFALLVAVPVVASRPAPRPAAAATTSPDYASETYGDPWDYSNPEDQRLDLGAGMLNVANARIDGGTLKFTTQANASFDPVLTFGGSIPWGRDGRLHPIDTGRYTNFAARIYSSSTQAAGLLWFSCPERTPSCQGGMPFQLKQGWNTYDLTLKANAAFGPTPWSGQLLAFRVLPGPAGNDIEVDWLRLAGGPTDPSAPFGAPLPVILDPDIAGGTDYATAVRGDAWDFDQATDTSGVHNATAVSFASSTLSATNAGPNQNDPQVDLPLGAQPIDATRYHRLSFTYSYDGPFGLADAPGGGTIARMVWQVQGGGPNNYQDLNDVVTYEGVNRVTIDLTTLPQKRGGLLDEQQKGAEIGWLGQQVTTLRFDPNEDPGARRWHLDDIRLAEDDRANGAFDIRFADNAWVDGTTADLFMDTDAAGYNGTKIASSVPVISGVNTYRWLTSGVPAGTYWVYVVLKHPDGATANAYSTGPVAVSPVGRLAGTDRIGTAVAIADASFPPGSAKAAVLARHDGFADALAGTPLAVAKGGPLLLTPSGGLSSRVGDALTRIVAKGATVYLAGGTGALSQAVEDQVRALGFTPERLAGANRYDTAVKIAGTIGSPSQVFETTGTNFPDALGAGAAAAKAGGAVLLTAGSQQAPETAAYLAANPAATRWAIGGPASVADPSARRIAGSDRYATSRLVAEQFFSGSPHVGVASGENFPDALAGGVHAVRANGPLLLTAASTLPPTIADYVTANKASIRGATIYGGTSAVSETVRGQLEVALR